MKTKLKAMLYTFFWVVFTIFIGGFISGYIISFFAYPQIMFPISLACVVLYMFYRCVKSTYKKILRNLNTGKPPWKDVSGSKTFGRE
jgi:uncharacterized membrane protein YfcA